MSGFLPYGRQTIEDDDVAAVADALRGDFLTTGPKVGEYERAFAQATGAAHAIACNSGTAALHLAVLGADIGPGDAVVVPATTFLATANVVRMTCAEVVFADVDPDTGLMTAETLMAALACAPRDHTIKAALPVHLTGQLCDMPALAAVAQAKGITLIEDACHALGIYNVGSCRYSQSVCFSTHPVKQIATAEGGVVTTADDRLATRMRSLRTHGMVRDAAAFSDHDLAFENGEANPWYYEMPEIGWNYRMSDVLCALGISQLGKLQRFVRRRVEIARLYDELLAPLFPALRPVPHGNHPHGWHIYAVLIDFAKLGTTRAQFMKALRAKNIGTQVHYIPIHLQPYYRQRYGALNLPGAEAYYARCLSIPLFPTMTNDDVRRVAGALAGLVCKA